MTKPASSAAPVVRVELEGNLVSLRVDGEDVPLPGENGGAAPGFSGEAPSLESLAQSQGVSPVADFDALISDFWPQDESADEFTAAVRRWRREGQGNLAAEGA